MADPELGVKRHCLSCGARFYDLKRASIVCPKCHAPFDPDAVFKVKKGKTESTTAQNQSDEKNINSDILLNEDLAMDDDALAQDVEDTALMEDADDLGEDNSMAEVIEHMETDDDN